MQGLRLPFRRLYATIPEGAAIARTASTPQAVRLRRLRRRSQPLPAGTTDANADGLSPSEQARYQRLVAKGELGAIGKEVSEVQWLERLNARRSRLRGVKTVKRNDGEEETLAVGQKVYLPNIIFRLVPNNTPSGQPYNPYEATFRIPQSVTKTDVRSYLSAVYGVQTTYIRTDNYLSPVTRQANGSWTRTMKHKTYKRAVVGLVDPFYYPFRLQDMDETDREARKKWIEEKFSPQGQKELQRYEMLRMTKSGSKDWKWRGAPTTNRANILKLVAERRAGREGYIQQKVQEWQDLRQRGEKIDIYRKTSPTDSSESKPTIE